LRFQFVRFFITLITLFYFQYSIGQFEYKAVITNIPGDVNQIEIRNSENEKLILLSPDSNLNLLLNSNKTLLFGYVNNEKVWGHYTSTRADVDTIIWGKGLQLIGTVEIKSQSADDFMQTIKARELRLNTGIGSGIENIIKMLGGVSSNNEMSSQFSVRGGNFDENLIYVNDIEIYRPQLIQNGQQEGLSFINPMMVDQIKFSAGGFESQYGDKMSSVLDVSYVRPDSNQAQVYLGTMINSAAVEGSKGKISGILSIRHFTNNLLTGTLNTQGTYDMNFADIQTYLNYQISKKWSLNFLGNLAQNSFQLRPESRTTEFGTLQAAYQLNVFMAGQENLNYNYQLGALTLKYQPSIRQTFKFISSLTAINEEEAFDVQGAYNLSELDRDLGSNNLGKPLRTLGYGYYLDHGRNRMQSRIFNLSHIGEFGKSTDKIQIKYGLRYNKEQIYDRYYEWLYMDSADYNIAPFAFSQDSIVLGDVVRSSNSIYTDRLSGYIQSRFNWGNWGINIGLRSNYWSLNNELIWMPRFSVNHTSSDNKTKVRMAVGAYYQPPFYRELRDFSGKLNTQLKSQKSLHTVFGIDKVVTLWGKEFKYTSEAYYKKLTDLVPYLYDNIRIRYYATNSSEGYAMGLDNRLYGQFNKGLESWFTLSLLQTQERITYENSNGEIIQSDWLRRPTDRRVNFAILFQDRLPNNPSIRVNLSLTIGGSVPYYLNGDARYTNNPNLISPYRRVDLGFSKMFRKLGDVRDRFKFIKESWITLDIFNLLDINNVIAFSWVKDLNNNRYGVPEYLTGRRINLRWFVSF